MRRPARGPGNACCGPFGRCPRLIQHTCGRQLTEVARHERAHSGSIDNIACRENVMVTPFHDKTAGVWSVNSRKRLVVLRAHQQLVPFAAVKSRYIATGSYALAMSSLTNDRRLLLHANGACYPLVANLSNLHTHWIDSVSFIGSDFILSAGWDGSMCFPAASPDPRPIARLPIKAITRVLDNAITADGRIAVAGAAVGATLSSASVWTPPLAVVDEAKEHALNVKSATFGSVAVSLTVPQHEAVPPVLCWANRVTAARARKGT